MKTVHEIQNQTWFEIAKIIDNEFIGTEKTFTANRYSTYYAIHTNQCDYASVIKVYYAGNQISEIFVLHSGVDGFTPIHGHTKDRINLHLATTGHLPIKDIQHP